MYNEYVLCREWKYITPYITTFWIVNNTCITITNMHAYMYLCLDDREANLEGTFETGGKGGGSLKCEMDAVSVIFPGRFCLRYIPEHS